jgi:hypothetical protein
MEWAQLDVVVRLGGREKLIERISTCADFQSDVSINQSIFQEN